MAIVGMRKPGLSTHCCNTIPTVVVVGAEPPHVRGNTQINANLLAERLDGLPTNVGSFRTKRTAARAKVGSTTCFGQT